MDLHPNQAFTLNRSAILPVLVIVLVVSLVLVVVPVLIILLIVVLVLIILLVIIVILVIILILVVILILIILLVLVIVLVEGHILPSFLRFRNSLARFTQNYSLKLSGRHGHVTDSKRTSVYHGI